MASKINQHLADGGLVQVTTYLQSRVYSQKHVGWFEMIDGSLYVRRGRSRDRLSHGEKLLVSIRFGREV